MRAIDLNNVIVAERAMKDIQQRLPLGQKAVVSVHPSLDETIRTLAILKPTWTFMGVDHQRMNAPAGADVPFYLSAFVVQEDGETLGHIKRDYVRRDYHIVVGNHRIAQGRERGSGYATLDPKKAVAKVKRMFGRRMVGERVQMALDAAATYTSNAVSRHRDLHGDAYRVVEKAARNWVLGEGLDSFLTWAAVSLPPQDRAAVFSANQKATLYKAEMTVLEDMRSRLNTNRSALIIRDGDQYIVRVSDNVQLYDDNTLPASLRGGLGMLKLVDKEHFIEGVGCRVNDNVYLVLIDEETNSVSQGESDE